MKLRYFDHNATTPLSAEGKAAWLDAVDRYWLNPSSPYRGAAAVRVRLEAAREELSGYLDVAPERVIFTSGATEANNAVLRHWAGRLSGEAKIGVNPTEHPSVLEAAKCTFGGNVAWLPLAQCGRVDLSAFEARLRSGELSAVSMMAANNETGVIQPWQAIADICRQAGVPYHCDASQWVGKMPLEGFASCSYVSASAHKFGGPKGVGFLVIPEVEDGFRLLDGGAQEGGHRAGTEDVAGVLSMLAALAATDTSGLPGVLGRDAFVVRVSETISGIKVVGADAPCLWNTVSLQMPKYSSARWIRALEKRGFLLSAGAACSTGKSGVSPVLLAMGFDATAAARVLRVSASCETALGDWLELADALVAIYDVFNAEAHGSTSRVISID